MVRLEAYAIRVRMHTGRLLSSFNLGGREPEHFYEINNHRIRAVLREDARQRAMPATRGKLATWC